MKTIEFTVDKEHVFTEIAKTTSYIGAKSNDAAAYERVFTTDEDADLLERFWKEAANVVTSEVKDFLISESDMAGVFSLVLSLSDRFKDALKDDMGNSLSSFFITHIASQWLMIANKEDAQGYATLASSYLEDFSRKVHHKMPPQRPAHNQI